MTPASFEAVKKLTDRNHDLWHENDALRLERDRLRAALKYLYEAWYEDWVDGDKLSLDEWIETIPRGGEE